MKQKENLQENKKEVKLVPLAKLAQAKNNNAKTKSNCNMWPNSQPEKQRYQQNLQKK